MGKISLANSKMQYSKELHDDVYQLEKAFGKQPEQLTSNLISMGATQKSWYPVLLLTEGKGNRRYIDDIEYSYPVIDSTRRGAITIIKSEYSDADTPGLNGAPFQLVVDDVLIVNYTYLVKDDIEIYCIDAVEVEGGYLGTFVMMDSNTNGSYVPVDCVKENARMSIIVAVVSMAASRGNGSTYATPYKKKNMLNMFRKSYKTEGEVVKQVVTFNYKKSDNTTKTYWMDYRKWQWRQEWAQEKELGLWYGRYNKRPDGVVAVKDPKSGNPAQRGSGLFEQITNKQSYSFLSAKFLQDITMQLFHGNGGEEGRELTLFTGTLGRRFFDDAMKQLMGESRFTMNSDKVVTGTPGNLNYNYGFTSYTTQEGHTIKVKTHPMFDFGPGADVADVVQGKLTTESARMVFVDTSSYDGEANLQLVVKRGWDEYSAKQNGFGSDTDGFMNQIISSDVHASSVHHGTIRGIELLKTTCCLDMPYKMA